MSRRQPWDKDPLGHLRKTYDPGIDDKVNRISDPSFRNNPREIYPDLREVPPGPSYIQDSCFDSLSEPPEHQAYSLSHDSPSYNKGITEPWFRRSVHMDDVELEEDVETPDKLEREFLDHIACTESLERQEMRKKMRVEIDLATEQAEAFFAEYQHNHPRIREAFKEDQQRTDEFFQGYREDSPNDDWDSDPYERDEWDESHDYEWPGDDFYGL